MKSETRSVLLKTYAQLHQIVSSLYDASQNALENNDLDDASLLESRADKLYEEAENLYLVITELDVKNENS